MRPVFPDGALFRDGCWNVSYGFQGEPFGAIEGVLVPVRDEGPVQRRTRSGAEGE
jgi:hypothetical protein